MNVGGIAGFGFVIGVGLICYGFIKRKCKKEVKVYNEIQYPEEKDNKDGERARGVGTTESGIESAESNYVEGNTESKFGGEHEGRGTVQDKSFEHDEQFNRGDEEPNKTDEPDSSSVESVEPIEIIPVEPIEE